MALLPSVFMLESGSRYLNLTKNVPASLPYGFLKFDEEQIWSPRVRFAAEPAKTGDGQFVHIRSLYNNKYLVKTQIEETKSWIFVASAKKTEEDPSKDSCTLFEPFSLKDDEPTSVRLRHVHKTKSFVNVSASSSEGDAQQGLLASSSNESVFRITDAADIVFLPSKVAILSNDHILESKLIHGENCQQFIPGSESDLANPEAAKELFRTPKGMYLIMDMNWLQYLTLRAEGWILADSQPSNTSPNCVFTFVQIEDNIFGIRSEGYGNHFFCGARSVSEEKKNCLSSYYPTLTYQTRLTVVERVLKREITDIVYRLSDARVYGEQPTEVDVQTTTNLLSKSTTKSTLTFTESNTRTSTWSNSQTINFGVSVSMTVATVPFISEGKIKLDAGFTKTHKWDETESTKVSRGTTHSVTVPPLKTYMVTLMATTGVCDVPFNYTQRDLLTTGEWVETKNKDDGLFKGINSYNFYYDQVEKKVDS
uniref:natterin-2-like n=1 Tax=Erigeron canadensis TaxID=72917 RepID=UPI001CB9489D|nr:natterin-2-like [Erigeron canadensis]